MERAPQAAEEVGQRVLEVAVLALAEAVPRHDGCGFGSGSRRDRAPRWCGIPRATRSFGRTAQP